MSHENTTQKGLFSAFIPFPLAIAELPELNVFPLNVLFGQCMIKDGKNTIATALYEPDLLSYTADGEKCSMEYYNAYGGDSQLLIEYIPSQKTWFGKKIVKGESGGMAFGVEWDMFFTHFTILGLTKGELCKFEEIEQ